MIRITWYDQKWSKIAMRFSLYGCVAAGCVFLVWYYGLSDHNITTITVLPDRRINYATRKSIEEYIHHFCFTSAEKAYNKNCLFKNLKKTFSCIKDTQSIRKKRTHVYLKFSVYTPAVALNNTHIVTLDGLLIGVHFYRSDIVITLPQISADHEIMPSELCQLAQWAVTVPDFLRPQVTIIWKNPTEIHLLFKEYPKNPVLITTQTILSPDVINAFKKIIADDDVVQLDARFDDMLVAQLDKKIKHKRRNI